MEEPAKPLKKSRKSNAPTTTTTTTTTATAVVPKAPTSYYMAFKDALLRIDSEKAATKDMKGPETQAYIKAIYAAAAKDDHQYYSLRKSVDGVCENAYKEYQAQLGKYHSDQDDHFASSVLHAIQGNQLEVLEAAITQANEFLTSSKANLPKTSAALKDAVNPLCEMRQAKEKADVVASIKAMVVGNEDEKLASFVESIFLLKNTINEKDKEIEELEKEKEVVVSVADAHSKAAKKILKENLQRQYYYRGRGTHSISASIPGDAALLLKM